MKFEKLTTHKFLKKYCTCNIFLKICAWSTSQISRELKKQLIKEFGEIPKLKLINVIGGGSSALGFWNEFIDYDKKHVELIGVEAKYAAPLSTNAKVAILHGAAQYCLTDKEGQIAETHSLSAGLDYPGIGPEHSFLHKIKRVNYHSVTDDEAVNALQWLSEKEGIIPALETAHAIAYLLSENNDIEKGEDVIVNLSGRGDKDVNTIAKYLGDII